MTEAPGAFADEAGATQVDVAWLVPRIEGRRAVDVKDGIAALIGDGTLPPGFRLPTIRDLARHLEVTPSVVSDAWSKLRAEGLVETRRRGGTRVLAPHGPRDAAGEGFAGWQAVELLHALPEVDVLPRVADVFAASVDPRRPVVSRPTITSELRDAAEETWGVAAESFTAVAGGRLAFDLAIRAALGPEPGVLALESPGMARNRAYVAQSGDRVIDLESDVEGPIPESVRRALRAGATALVFQPNGRIPLGSRMTDRRRDLLAGVLVREGQETWVIEEEPLSRLFGGTGLAAVLPQRTVRIAQYWRAYGPDVDTVVIAGSSVLIDRIREQQRHRGLRAGRLQQTVLAHLLRDAEADRQVAAAGRLYRRRYDGLRRALGDHGVEVVSSPESVFICVPVVDAARAVTDLSSVGIRVMSTRGPSQRDGRSLLRIAVTRLPDDPERLDELAAIIALAVGDEGLLDTE